VPAIPGGRCDFGRAGAGARQPAPQVRETRHPSGYWAVPAIASALAQDTDRVRIPPGEFAMGRSDALPDDRLQWVPNILRDNRPAQTIGLSGFDTAVHDVTNRQYSEFVAAYGGSVRVPRYWPDGRLPEGRTDDPVANVRWDWADASCQWRGKRLPTEAEWERACRGDLEAARCPWGDGEADETKAHFDSVKGPKVVCSYPKNGLGLCDMAGNVWEWTADTYGKDYYSQSPAENPTGATDGRYRVLRGGSWADVPKFLTCAQRSFSRPEERSPNIGFRCVRRADEHRRR